MQKNEVLTNRISELHVKEKCCNTRADNFTRDISHLNEVKVLYDSLLDIDKTLNVFPEEEIRVKLFKEVVSYFKRYNAARLANI